jgi:hypothetical protein
VATVELPFLSAQTLGPIGVELPALVSVRVRSCPGSGPRSR